MQRPSGIGGGLQGDMLAKRKRGVRKSWGLGGALPPQQWLRVCRTMPAAGSHPWSEGFEFPLLRSISPPTRATERSTRCNEDPGVYPAGPAAATGKNADAQNIKISIGKAETSLLPTVKSKSKCSWVFPVVHVWM